MQNDVLGIPDIQVSNNITTNTISEFTTNSGVTIDGLLIKDNFYKNPYCAKLRSTITQTISDATFTILTFNTIDYDNSPDSLMTANSNRIDIVKTGKYTITASMYVASGAPTVFNVNNRISLYIRKNGSDNMTVNGGYHTTAPLTVVDLSLSSGDYIQVGCYFKDVSGGSWVIGSTGVQQHIQNRLEVKLTSSS